MEIYAWIESVFQIAVQYGILAMEALGMAVLLVTAARSAKGWLTGDPHVRLTLAQGFALSLEFKLGSEVLRTVVVRDWSELGILGAVIALRGALTFLIHWEIKNEETKMSVYSPRPGPFCPGPCLIFQDAAENRPFLRKTARIFSKQF